MIFIAITLLTALGLSAIAAYFSIVGLVFIFSAAPIPIIIMGSFLEVAKLVSASWLYRNWSTAPSVIKYYFTTAVVILSLITSMGIFGYLSKAHIEQTTLAGTNNIQLQILEQQEKIAKQRIDFLLSQNEKSTVVSNRISRELQAAQNELKAVVEKKAPLLQDKNKLDAEIGPIRYITEFIYGQSDEALINKAVRWVIVTLIFVFDPLAILLLIAVNISIRQQRAEPEKASSFNLFVTDTGEEKIEPAPVKDDWSPQLHERAMRDETGKIKIDKTRIHSIPKEILDKVFRK